MPLDGEAFGFWLKAAFGAPTTTGAEAPYSRVFQSGSWTLPSLSIETDILDGRWDNAEVKVWRVDWAGTSQRVLMRRGAIGQIRRGRLAFVAEVRSLAHVLGQTVGRTFQATCDAALGDARCGVDLEDPACKATGAVIDLLRDRAFTASGPGGFDSGWFTFGTLEWTSGANAGRRTEVLGHDIADGIAVLTLLEAPVRAIAEDDDFTPRAGCDKRITTCGSKFANTLNVRGFPHIPGKTRSCGTRRRTAGTRGPCCEGGRTHARHRHSIPIARSWLGTPYHDQASVRGVGCDCLGLARGVWREVVGPEPFPFPPYSRDWGDTGPREASEPVPRGTNRSSGAIGGGEGPIGLADGARRMMTEIPPANAPPGALLLLRMKPRAIPKHVGLLTGPATFLHAYDRLGVIEEPLTHAWRRRIAFAFLFLQR